MLSRDMALFATPTTPPPPAELRFTFIDVPDDQVVDENPDAQLISDVARLESGPVPRETTPDGRLPPSVGNTREKIAGGEAPAPRSVVAPPPQPQAIELPQGSPVPADEANRSDEEAEEAGAQTPASSPTASNRGPAPPQGKGESGPGKGRSTSGRKTLGQILDAYAAKPAIPTDLQALAPDAPQGSAGGTRWNFDNPNPAFPVRIGSLSFDSKGADFGPWLKEFHARVLNEWNRNIEEWHERVWQDIVGARLVTDSEKWNRYAVLVSQTRGVTGVNFEVTREGSVVKLDVIHASGTLDLDRSVHKTLRNVLLPPLPDDYPDDSLLIRAGFYYNVDPPE
jgi:hypothetical protein